MSHICLSITGSGSIVRYGIGNAACGWLFKGGSGMTPFRFLHAADIHLDSPLIGLSDVEGRVAECIRTAPRTAFELLAEQAIKEEVNFLVIAGDLYDGTWRDYKTGLFFAEQMGRLNQARIPVFLLHGNHDAQSQITKPLVLPDNVKVFGIRRAKTFQIEELNVALHGLPDEYRFIQLTGCAVAFLLVLYGRMPTPSRNDVWARAWLAAMVLPTGEGDLCGGRRVFGQLSRGVHYLTSVAVGLFRLNINTALSAPKRIQSKRR